MVLKLGAQLGASFGGTFDNAQKKLADTQKEIQSLNKAQSNISAYKKQESAMASCLKQQSLYREQIANLKKEQKALTKENGEHATGSANLANKILELEKKMTSAAESEEKHREALKRLGNELKAVGVNTKDLSGEMEKIEGKIDDLKKSQEETADGAEDMGDRSANAFKELGEAIASAGILKLLKEGYSLMTDMAKGAAAFGDEIATTSVQYGIATDDLMAYYYAAELVDVSAETLTSTMSRNIRAMSDARDGTENYVQAYEKLGVKVTDANGELRDAETVYWEVIDALGEMNNETERDALAIELLGRSAQQVNPLIAAGSGVVKGYAEEAKKAGYVLSDKLLANATALDDEIQKQNSNMAALKNTIGAQLAPEYTGLKEVQNTVITATTRLAAEHPGLVRGVTASATAFGLATGGLVAFTGIVTKVLPLMKSLGTAMSTAIPGIGPVLAITGAVAGLIGVTVAAHDANEDEVDVMERLTLESREYKKELDELTAQREELGDITRENAVQVLKLEKQIAEVESKFGDGETLGEFLARVDETIAASEQRIKDYDDATQAIYGQQFAALGLIDELSKLADQTQMTASAEAQMKQIVDYLNNSIDGLGLTYDKVLSKDFNFEKIYTDLIEDWAQQEFAELSLEKAVGFRVTGIQLELDKQALEKELEAAQEEVAKAEAAVENSKTTITDHATGISYSYTSPEVEKRLRDAREKVKTLKTKYSDLETRIKGNNKSYAEATATIEAYYGLNEDGIPTLQNTIDKVRELGKTYQEEYKKAYNAAYESISGQYELWDVAAEVVPKSIGDINNALATQTSYWSDYNKDMSLLLERGQDIEGLAEVVATFADGSADSVNAIAGMAAASDEDLKLMVKNYEELKKQQDEAAVTLAASTSKELQELEDQMRDTIDDLDMSAAARANAEKTMNAYTAALREGSAEAASILTNLAKYMGAPAPSSLPRNYVPAQAYASGTDSALPGWALVGEEGPELAYFGGGEKVYNARDTERILMSAGEGSVRNTITISPTFYISGNEDDTDALEEYSEIVANMVLSKLGENNIDVKRGAFV